MNRTFASALLGATLLGATLLLAACGERPPVIEVQRGYRGTAMDQVFNPRLIEEHAALNAQPADPPMVPSEGPRAATVFKNLQVVGDTSVAEFTRLMVSITAWVAPQQGCTYCHKAGEDFSSDALYTKVVSRRMLQMTRHINADWKTHVANTGVTCYTCHRGLPVPANVWFQQPEMKHPSGVVGNNAGQNSPAPAVGLASLPYDPFTPFLESPREIRVIGPTALETTNRRSIKQAEYTYGLMMHMSQSLGVNCTYCHNSRSFAEWDTSTPQRATAWYGIRLARDLNVNYLDPLLHTFPVTRLGPMGDVPKVNCATCHQGAFKPLYGASLLATHPELAGVRAAVVPDGAASAPGVAAAVPSEPHAAVLLFAVGSQALAPDGAAQLAPLVKALQNDPATKIKVSGFTSASGDSAQNETLAKQRAFAVRDALKSAGIPEERIVLDKPHQIEANAAGEDEQARRVDVAIQ